VISDANERLRRTITGRDLTIILSVGDEARLRLWIDRFNRDIEACKFMEAGDLLDPDSDRDLMVAFTTCMNDGLTADETHNGLHGFLWGDVVTQEQAAEMYRRRAEGRA
jgi:hypothetical protein